MELEIRLRLKIHPHQPELKIPPSGQDLPNMLG
jgi:hypothetical protein